MRSALVFHAHRDLPERERADLVARFLVDGACLPHVDSTYADVRDRNAMLFFDHHLQGEYTVVKDFASRFKGKALIVVVSLMKEVSIQEIPEVMDGIFQDL